MARSDYAHWNEEQDRVWWEEEGRHETDPNADLMDHGYDGGDPDDESWRDEPEPDEEDDDA